MKMETINIPEVEKQYKDEWLLFEVYETDELNYPLKGRLLAHSPSRAVVDEVSSKAEYPVIYITYAGEKPRKGMKLVL
jgi:hypothetical protein